jgi:DNA-directed RNA polymerase subunit M/transcription elongation factor TFIIS
MENFDQAEEHRRLEELYAQMSDEQLAAMDGKIEDLTDIAQRVLRAEISKRRLDAQVPDVPRGDFAPREEELTRVWVAKDSAEAESVMGTLESAGIPACLGTEKMEYVNGSFEEKPVVKVVTWDQGRALELLRQSFPQEQEPEPEEDPGGLPVCPKCHSPDIVFQGLDTKPAPDAKTRYNWTCDACGHQWRDDGLEQLA